MAETFITREQWAIVRQQLGPHLRYLRRLFNRMEKLGVPQDDEVFIAARKAVDVPVI